MHNYLKTNENTYGDITGTIIFDYYIVIRILFYLYQNRQTP